jgi:hypothetical protein
LAFEKEGLGSGAGLGDRAVGGCAGSTLHWNFGERSVSGTTMARQQGVTGVAAIALGLGIALAIVVDLGAPRGDGGYPTQTARRAATADGLAARMEAQIAAGAPGVALALEDQAKPDERHGAAVSAAHAHAQFELGDAPAALHTVRIAMRICDVTNGCSYGERAQLMRLETVIGAVVEAGVVDPKSSPARVDEALHGLLRPAAFR